MSFNELRKPELQKAAERFIPDYNEDWKVEELRDELKAAGVTYDMYLAAFASEEVEIVPIEETDLSSDEPDAGDDVEFALVQKPHNGNVPVVETKKVEDDLVLLKMERANPRFETYGFTFLREHPFKLVPAEVARLIVESDRGFRYATPDETRDYYG